MKIRWMMICFTFFALTNFQFAQNTISYATQTLNPGSDNRGKSITVFEFNAFSHDYELEAITVEMAGDHPLGSLIAKKFFLLDEKYLSEEILIPGNPQTKTVIKKPVIY